MGFFKNVGTESVMLCKKLADFNNLKDTNESDSSPWDSSPWFNLTVYITRNTGTCAVVRYLLDSKRINIDDLITYVYRSKTRYGTMEREAIKSPIKYSMDRLSARIYRPESGILYCYGGPNGGMTDKHAERIFNDATELLKYLNIKYIKKGSYKQHNIRIVFN